MAVKEMYSVQLVLDGNAGNEGLIYEKCCFRLKCLRCLVDVSACTRSLAAPTAPNGKGYAWGSDAPALDRCSAMQCTLAYPLIWVAKREHDWHVPLVRIVELPELVPYWCICEDIEPERIARIGVLGCRAVSFNVVTNLDPKRHLYRT